MEVGGPAPDPVPPPNGSAQDSGVETECDQESNDSSMSSASLGVAQAVAPLAFVPDPQEAGPSAPLPPLPPTPEPVLPTSTASASLMPPPSVTEDGYLGDCSSDGGNEKNFPMPPEKLKRLLFHRQAGGDSGSEGNSMTLPHSSSDPIDPPAGIAFQNLSQEHLHTGYQIAGHAREASEPWGSLPSSSTGPYPSNGTSRKMRSFIRNKLSSATNSNYWSHMKVHLAGRKLRVASNMNNLEMMNRLLEGGSDPNGVDEHQRSALHFAAAKGYSDIVNSLLQHGADPNQKDSLGNTALHLAACTHHIGVVTLLLRAGTNLQELDNNGRTPVQLAHAKLKMLQRNKASAVEMTKIKSEVQQVVEMMREYLCKSGHATNSAYNDLLNTFSKRFTLHKNQDEMNSDLQVLLDQLENLQV